MSSRVTALALLLLSAAAACAQDWGDFAMRSDSSQDAMLVGVMNESDLDTALGICAGVSRRRDIHVGPYIDAILDSQAGGRSLRSETLLRELLEGLFDYRRTSPGLPSRVAANSDAIERLLGSLSAWNDPQLVASLVRILPFSEAPSRLKALMDVGERIIQGIQEAGGMLTPQETSLAMDYLGSVVTVGSRDFLDQCASIARLSTDAGLVKAARTAALALQGSP